MNMMKDTAVRAHIGPWRRNAEFIIEAPGYSVEALVFKPVPECTEIFQSEPTFTLTMDAAQVLMDDLWNCGLRPTEGTGSAGSLAATQKHLEDMRTIAFGKLGIQ